MNSSLWTQLEKWDAAKPKIRASFIGDGLAATFEGSLALNRESRELRLIDSERKVVWVVSLDRATPSERLEPLVDLPDGLKLQVDFFVALALRLPTGILDLFEIVGEEEIDKDLPPR